MEHEWEAAKAAAWILDFLLISYIYVNVYVYEYILGEVYVKIAPAPPLFSAACSGPTFYWPLANSSEFQLANRNLLTIYR